MTKSLPSVTIVRRIKASPAKVWGAITQPELMMQWWGPDAGPTISPRLTSDQAVDLASCSGCSTAMSTIPLGFIRTWFPGRSWSSPGNGPECRSKRRWLRFCSSRWTAAPN